MQLGQGQFGEVTLCEARLDANSEVSLVAVKMLRRDADHVARLDSGTFLSCVVNLGPVVARLDSYTFISSVVNLPAN